LALYLGGAGLSLADRLVFFAEFFLMSLQADTLKVKYKNWLHLSFLPLPHLSMTINKPFFMLHKKLFSSYTN